jgi:hypothetical protein
MHSFKWSLTVLVLFSGLAFGENPPRRVKGQLLYLPIYSHIWHGEITRDGQPIKTLLSISVSIRNTDPSNAITLTSAQYFNTGGAKLKEYLSAPRTIAPMATYELFIARSDDTGGSGANFVIAWKSDSAASAPIVEAIHADLPGSRTIIFTTAARQIAVD